MTHSLLLFTIYSAKVSCSEFYYISLLENCKEWWLQLVEQQFWHLLTTNLRLFIFLPNRRYWISEDFGIEKIGESENSRSYERQGDWIERQKSRQSCVYERAPTSDYKKTRENFGWSHGFVNGDGWNAAGGFASLFSNFNFKTKPVLDRFHGSSKEA